MRELGDDSLADKSWGRESSGTPTQALVLDFDLGPAVYILRFLTNCWSFIEHLVHTGEQGLGVKVKWENRTDGKTVAKRGWNYAGVNLGRTVGPRGRLNAWSPPSFQMSPQFRAWNPNLGSPSDCSL